MEAICDELNKIVNSIYDRHKVSISRQLLSIQVSLPNFQRNNFEIFF